MSSPALTGCSPVLHVLLTLAGSGCDNMQDQGQATGQDQFGCCCGRGALCGGTRQQGLVATSFRVPVSVFEPEWPLAPLQYKGLTWIWWVITSTCT